MVAGHDVNGDAAITPERAHAINSAARRELERIGITSRVTVSVAAGDGRALGTYRRGVLSILRPGGNWKHTLDREIMHALRERTRRSGTA